MFALYSSGFSVYVARSEWPEPRQKYVAAGLSIRPGSVR